VAPKTDDPLDAGPPRERASEETLLRALAAGDERAFQVLFDRYAETVRRRVDAWLPAAVKRRVSVADVLQEVNLVALRRFPEFEDRGDGAFRNWLLRIAQLKAKAAVRRHVGTAKRTTLREVSRPHRMGTGEYAQHGPSPSEAAMASERMALVRRALAELPYDYREILRLTREQQLTLREAAERMGRPRERVKKLYGRAVDRFARVFRSLRGGGDV
jgi:RNA polymerase sigma-70 factor (ECF subfamily)